MTFDIVYQIAVTFDQFYPKTAPSCHSIKQKGPKQGSRSQEDLKQAYKAKKIPP